MEYPILRVHDTHAKSQNATVHHYCPVKRDVESLNAVCGNRFQAKRSVSDVNVKMIAVSVYVLVAIVKSASIWTLHSTLCHRY